MADGKDNTERVWNVSCEDCGAVILGGRRLRLCLHCDGWVCGGCHRLHEARHGSRKPAGRSEHAAAVTTRLVAEGVAAEKTEKDCVFV